MKPHVSKLSALMFSLFALNAACAAAASPAPVVVSATPARSLAAAGELLRELVFQGNTEITRDELLTAAKPWLNQPLNAADLEALRIEITRYYVDRGYINSGARLAPDGLRDGKLTLEITEGRLSAIQLSGLDGLADAYVAQRLLPDPTQPFNLNELRERYQLMLDDPLIRRMNARIVPGLEPGLALLDIAVQRAQPWLLTLRFNNYRPASIGENTVGVELGWRNLTGRGDLLQVHVQQPLAAAQDQRAGLAWQVPLNYRGTQLSLQLDEGDSSVREEPLKSVGVTSTLHSANLGIQQLLWESLSERAALGVNYSARRSRSWLDGQAFAFTAGEPDDGTRVSGIKFWQEYSQRSAQDVVALRSTFTASHNNLLTLPAAAKALVPPRDYWFWLGQAHYARQLGESGAQLVVRATLQEGAQRMLALDGLSIGGVATVRGFRENQLIRDRGHVLNLELDYAWRNVEADGFGVNLVPFIDYGGGRNHGGQSESIGSVGLALRWRWLDVVADLALASRVLRSSGVLTGQGSWQDSGVHFQLSYSPRSR